MPVESIFLLVGVTYVVSLTFGYAMQRYLKIPWMFAPLFFGIFLSATGIFSGTLGTDSFQVISTLGMLMMLFLIGFSLDLKAIMRLRKQVVTGTLLIVLGEALVVSAVLYFLFPGMVDHSYLVALVVALSFATVGEAILLPILKEFDVLGTTFGQLTLGIGTFDDIIEVLTLVSLTGLALLPAANTAALPPAGETVAMLTLLLAASLGLLLAGGRIRAFLSAEKQDFVHYVIMLTLFFGFSAAAGYVFDALMPVAAILAGLVSRQIIPKESLEGSEKNIEFLGYVFLSPVFFLSVGSGVSLQSIVVSPVLILCLYVAAMGTKLLVSYGLFRKMLGAGYSLLMGVGLSVRFSTSLVVQYILLSSGLITTTLYSALIATAIIMTPLIIGIYSLELSKGKPP